jgi:plastocyanin
MKKGTIAAIAVAVVIVIVIGIVVLERGKKNGNNTSSANGTSSSTSSNNTTPQTPTATNAVSISNFSFSPANITVKKGTTVTWTNNDSTTHTVTGDTNGGPKSGDLNPGKAYSFTFSAAGTFAYHCSIHPDMTGTVTVTE